MKNEIFETVSICGLGLIGSSLGMCIKKRKIAKYVIGIVRRKEIIKIAREKGVIDYGTDNLSEGIRNADLFIVCTPVGNIVEIIKNSLPYLKKGCLITDVGSTKKEVVLNVEKIIRDDISFIGGHPIAGSELSSIEFAEENLFENNYYILTPSKKYKKNLFIKLKKFVKSLGSKVVVLTPSEHDFYLSFTSHLPHLVAFCLTNTLTENENWGKYIGNSFKDTTRVAKSPPIIWQDIFFSNKCEILKALKKFRNNLDKFELYLKKNDEKKIYKFLESAKIKKENLCK